MRLPVADLLADLAAAFDALGIRWYLFGAQAAIVYGMARLTADVDVTIGAPRLPTAEWLAVLETHGFECRFADPAFAERTRVVPVVHLPSGLPVDIVIRGPDSKRTFCDAPSSRRLTASRYRSSRSPTSSS